MSVMGERGFAGVSKPLPWPRPGSGDVAPRGPESSRRHGLSEKPHKPPTRVQAHTRVRMAIRGGRGAVSSTSPSLSPAFPKAAVSFFHRDP